jgi:transcriptional regulator with XRE-family HTH domain
MDKEWSGSPTRPSLGEAIQAAIKGRVTQAAIAKEIGVSQPTVSRWIQGEILPTVHDISQIEAFVKREVPSSHMMLGDVLRAAGYVEDRPEHDWFRPGSDRGGPAVDCLS